MPSAPDAALARAGAVVARRPLAVVLLVLLASIPFAAGAARLGTDNRTEVFLVRDDPSLPGFRRFQEAFGNAELVLVQLDGGPPRDPRFLAFLSDATLALARAPGVEGVVSAATIYAPEVEVLLEPGGWDELARLEPRSFGGPLNRRLKLLELDVPRATISVSAAPGGARERAPLAAAIARLREDARAHGIRVAAAGSPLTNVALDRAAREVDSIAMPLLTAVCVAATLLTTRSARITVAAFACTGLAVLFTSGLVALGGGTRNLVVAMADPLIFVLVLATAIHVSQAYVEGLRAGLDRPAAAAHAVAEKGLPCFLTAVTSALGFASFASASVAPIRAFGLTAAAAALLGLVLTLTFFVALLALVGPRTAPASGRDLIGGTLGRLAALVTGPRAAAVTIAAAAGLMAAGALAAAALPVDTHPIDYFPPRAEVRRDFEAVEAAGRGVVAIEVVVRARDGSAIAASERAHEAVRRFEAAVVAAHPDTVVATVSWPSVVADRSHAATGHEATPAASLLERALDSPAGARRAARLFSGDRRALRVTVLARRLEAERFFALVADIECEFAEAGAAAGLAAEVTGSAALVLRTQAALVEVLGLSVGATAVTVGLVMLLLLRSIRIGLLTLPATAFSVLLAFLLMRVLGFALDVGTVMSASVILGIAVDDAVHISFHYRRAVDRGLTPVEAVAAATREVGRAVSMTSAIVAAGFFSLAVHGFLPAARFGIVCGAGMGFALLGNGVVLAALLGRLGPTGAAAARAVATGEAPASPHG